MSQNSTLAKAPGKPNHGWLEDKDTFHFEASLYHAARRMAHDLLTPLARPPKRDPSCPVIAQTVS
jgi:hypothetical protein